MRLYETDIAFEDQGSIVIIRAVSDQGREWVEEHVASEGWQHYGGGIAADARMARAVREGAQEDGLEVTA